MQKNKTPPMNSRVCDVLSEKLNINFKIYFDFAIMPKAAKKAGSKKANKYYNSKTFLYGWCPYQPKLFSAGCYEN